VAERLSAGPAGTFDRNSSRQLSVSWISVNGGSGGLGRVRVVRKCLPSADTLYPRHGGAANMVFSGKLNTGRGRLAMREREPREMNRIGGELRVSERRVSV
jgi:hypothetical protein